MRMPFGKHKGLEIPAIPTDYLKWLMDHVELKDPLLSEVCNVLWTRERRQEEYYVPAPRLPNDNTIKGIYRRLALKWHPDKGGTTEAMAALNDFYSEILGAI